MPMSPEARARLAARNKATRQWEKACNTGPKTQKGRQRVGQNALKHGARHASMRVVAEWLKSVRSLLTNVRNTS